MSADDTLRTSALPAAGDAADLGRRSDVLARVLAGELTDPAACELLGVEPLALARWKLHALEAIAAHDPAAAPDPVELLGSTGAPTTSRPSALRTIRPRVAAAAGAALLAFVLVASLASSAAVLEVLDAVTRWILYAATLFAAGGTLFLWQIHDRNGSPQERVALARWVRAGAVVGVLATLLGLAIHGAALAGAGPFGLLDHHSLSRAADGSYGASAAMRLLGLGYIGYAVGRQRALASGRLVAGVGAIVALASFLLVGHTVVAEPRALVVPANLLHTAAGAGWFGGLVLLGLTVRYRRVADDLEGAAVVVQRFSRFAMGSVVLVVAAGTALAIVELPGIGSLATSPYGRMVLAKLLLVAIVLLVADRNHRRIVPAIVAHDRGAWVQLRRTVQVEVAGLVLVLLATALLVNLSPPA